MDLLPELWACVFTLCSSKDRSILCQVSREWYNISLAVSKRLSPLSYDDTLYDDEQLYRSGDYHLIVRLKRKYKKMHQICLSGNIDVVRLMISLGATNWNNGLQGACKGGHLELVDLMISHGAYDWNLGLYGACEGGHFKLIQLMISRGANDWNNGLLGACTGGHLELAKLMISYGANSWIWPLTEACHNKHNELIQLMLSCGASRCLACGKPPIDH
jgi:hypothetical protein